MQINVKSPHTKHTESSRSKNLLQIWKYTHELTGSKKIFIITMIESRGGGAFSPRELYSSGRQESW